MADAPTFLVVDDVPMFRELGTLFLARYGRVITASSGYEALEIVRRERPDAVVVDLHLPDVDGATVCREIRTAPATAHIPVVVVTGGSAAEHARAVRAGACDVLTKPLSRSTLTDSVHRFVSLPGPRGLPRVEVAAPVRVVVGERTAWGTARNVSRGGMFIEGDVAPEQADELRLEFVLPGSGATLRPTARAVWRRASSGGRTLGVGVRFLALDRESASWLDAYVHERFVPAVAALREAPAERPHGPLARAAGGTRPGRKTSAQ